MTTERFTRSTAAIFQQGRLRVEVRPNKPDGVYVPTCDHTPTEARTLAAMLLAAADEHERLAAEAAAHEAHAAKLGAEVREPVSAAQVAAEEAPPNPHPAHWIGNEHVMRPMTVEERRNAR